MITIPRNRNSKMDRLRTRPLSSQKQAAISRSAEAVCWHRDANVRQVRPDLPDCFHESVTVCCTLTSALKHKLQSIAFGQKKILSPNHCDKTNQAFNPRCQSGASCRFASQFGGGPGHVQSNFTPTSVGPILTWSPHVEPTLTGQIMSATN